MQQHLVQYIAKKATVSLAIIVLLFSTLVFADETYDSEKSANAAIPNFFALGVGFTPEYSGSSDQVIGVIPALYYQFKNSNRFIEWYALTVSMNVLDSPNWQIGPVLSLKLGRSDVDDSVVKKMSDIDTTVEGGVTLSYSYTNFEGIPWRFRAGTNIVTDLGGVYNGVNASVWGNFWFPASRKTLIGISGGASWNSKDYNQTYYGVNAKDSLASGLPLFEPDNGFSDWSLRPMVLYKITPKWIAGAGLIYKRISGDPADSPIVKRGNADQWSGGIGVGYVW